MRKIKTKFKFKISLKTIASRRFSQPDIQQKDELFNQRFREPGKKQNTEKEKIKRSNNINNKQNNA